MISRRTLFAALGGLALSACATTEPAGPRETPRTPPSGAEAEVNFYDHTRPYPSGQSLTITFDDGGVSRTVGSDLRLRDFGFPSTPRYPTRTSGTLRITVTLNRDGRPVASETLELPLQRDWIWGVAVHTEADNPVQHCIGCMGARRQPIDAASTRVSGEAMWLVWSGQSILNPAVA